MSARDSEIMTLAEFLDSLPMRPCPSKLPERFCSVCRRLNREVADWCEKGDAPVEEEYAGFDESEFEFVPDAMGDEPVGRDFDFGPDTEPAMAAEEDEVILEFVPHSPVTAHGHPDDHAHQVGYVPVGGGPQGGGVTFTPDAEEVVFRPIGYERGPQAVRGPRIQPVKVEVAELVSKPMARPGPAGAAPGAEEPRMRLQRTPAKPAEEVVFRPAPAGEPTAEPPREEVTFAPVRETAPAQPPQEEVTFAPVAEPQASQPDEVVFAPAEEPATPVQPPGEVSFKPAEGEEVTFEPAVDEEEAPAEEPKTAEGTAPVSPRPKASAKPRPKLKLKMKPSQDQEDGGEQDGTGEGEADGTKAESKGKRPKPRLKPKKSPSLEDEGDQAGTGEGETDGPGTESKGKRPKPRLKLKKKPSQEDEAKEGEKAGSEPDGEAKAEATTTPEGDEDTYMECDVCSQRVSAEDKSCPSCGAIFDVSE